MVKMIKQKMKEQKGFTLIELLAVIVILGIIAAIAIPAIGNVISKSEEKAEAQEGVQIINAAKMYMANEPIDTLTFSGSPSKATITRAQLEGYLDHVEAEETFSVIVEKSTASSGKFKYELKGHPAAGDGEEAILDEQSLIENANGK